jgi:hypothetical protein
MGGYSSKSSSSTAPQEQAATAAATAPLHQQKNKKKIEITSIDRAILDLKNARDKLQRYRTRLLLEDEKLMTRVKQAKAQNKTSYALQLLKLHHYKMQQYDQCNDQLINILQMVQTIDSKQNDVQIIQALQAGKDTLQQLHSEISIDHLMELMDEISEQHETEQEISNIIQQNIPNLMTTTAAMETDEELLAELELLQQPPSSTTMTSAETTANTTTLPDLPTVPTHKLPELATATTATTTPVQSTEERIAVLG